MCLKWTSDHLSGDLNGLPITVPTALIFLDPGKARYSGQRSDLLPTPYPQIRDPVSKAVS